MPAETARIQTLLLEGSYRPAFELLAAHFGDRILRLAYAISGNREAAEDITQEVFIRIWRALPLYRAEASLSTWIFAITRNAALSAIAKSKRRPEISLSEPAIQAQAEAKASPYEWTSAKPDVARLVQALPDHLRQTTALFYLEGRSYEQVADSLAIPLGTVKTNLHRARKAMIDALASKETV